MRFKITLEINRKSRDIILPINYQYALSSFIYHTINKGNKDLANWLHERGFILDNKSFKLFTFSGLQISKYKQYDDRLIILSDKLEFILSFFPIELTESFVFGLFSEREFSLGDKKSSVQFTATNVERLPDPEFTHSMEFKTLSPVVLSTKTDGSEKYAQYMSPTDGGYPEKLKNNLLRKYAAYCDYYNKQMEQEDSGEMELNILSEPKKKGVLIKAGTKEESKVIGYQYKFSIRAHPELIKTGYYAGFGEKNSMGFGCVA